jgi:hypothetical protein
MFFLNQHSTFGHTVAFTFLLFLLGCNRGPQIVPTAGKISIDGKPLTTGMIMVFHKGYRGAVAMIQNDGSFIFKTHEKNDGCLLGEHPITISCNRNVNDSTVEYLIPEHYSDVNRSNTKIKIDGANSDLKIDLTWKGSGHTGPYTSGN